MDQFDIENRKLLEAPIIVKNKGKTIIFGKEEKEEKIENNVNKENKNSVIEPFIKNKEFAKYKWLDQIIAGRVDFERDDLSFLDLILDMNDSNMIFSYTKTSRNAKKFKRYNEFEINSFNISKDKFYKSELKIKTRKLKSEKHSIPANSLDSRIYKGPFSIEEAHRRNREPLLILPDKSYINIFRHDFGFFDSSKFTKPLNPIGNRFLDNSVSYDINVNVNVKESSNRKDKIKPNIIMNNNSNKEKTENKFNALKADGNMEINFLDLSLVSGEFVLIERVEEDPHLLQKSGMVSKMIEYFSSFPSKGKVSKNIENNEVKKPLKNSYVTERIEYEKMNQSPFFNISINSKLLSLKNSSFEVPLFEKKISKNDFVLVYDLKENFFIRRIGKVFVTGQTFISSDIYDNRTQRSKDFAKRKMKLYLKRKLNERKKVSIEHLVEAFPLLREDKIKLEVKQLCDINKGEGNLSWCVPKSDVLHFENSLDSGSVLNAENFCTYEAMSRGLVMLREHGIKHWKELMTFFDSYLFSASLKLSSEDREVASHIEDQINDTPWAVSKLLDEVAKGKCMLSTYNFNRSQTSLPKQLGMRLRRMGKVEERVLKSLAVPFNILYEYEEDHERNSTSESVGGKERAKERRNKFSKRDLCILPVLANFDLLRHVFEVQNQMYSYISKEEKANTQSDVLETFEEKYLLKICMEIEKDELEKMNKKYISIYKRIKYLVDSKMKTQNLFPSNDSNLLTNYFFRIQLNFNQTERFLKTGEFENEMEEGILKRDRTMKDLERDLLNELHKNGIEIGEMGESNGNCIESVEDDNDDENNEDNGGVMSKRDTKKIKVKRQRLKRTIHSTDAEGKEVLKTDYIYDPELIADYILDQKDGGDRLMERLGLNSEEFKKFYYSADGRNVRKTKSNFSSPSYGTSTVANVPTNLRKGFEVCTVCGEPKHTNPRNCRGFTLFGTQSSKGMREMGKTRSYKGSHERDYKDGNEGRCELNIKEKFGSGFSSKKSYNSEFILDNVNVSDMSNIRNGNKEEENKRETMNNSAMEEIERNRVVRNNSRDRSKKDLRIRSRGDPRLDFANILKACMKEIFAYKNHIYFVSPVDTKQYKNYLKVVKKPICLNEILCKINRMAESATDFSYYSIEHIMLFKRNPNALYKDFPEFLKDLKQIHINSEIFNGLNHVITVWAKQVFEIGKRFVESIKEERENIQRRLKEQQTKLLLQPFLSEVLDAMKNCYEASVFLNPVNSKFAKNYYQIIKKPISISCIRKKLNCLNYGNVKSFSDDCKLILSNCIKYNGEHSLFTEKAKIVLSKGNEKLKELKEYIVEWDEEASGINLL